MSTLVKYENMTGFASHLILTINPTERSVINWWEEKQRKLIATKILLNRIKTPDGTILTSHDITITNGYIDKNGESYSIGGGYSYFYRYASDNSKPYEELSITTDFTFETIRKETEFNINFGKLSRPLYKKIYEMSNDNLKYLCEYIKNNKFIDRIYIPFLEYFQEELKYRSINGQNKV